MAGMKGAFMRYVVVGAGAVGGVIGARLVAARRNVVLVARGDHLKAIQSDGLQLHTPDGIQVVEVPAVGDVGEADLQLDDVVVVAVKSQQTSAVMEALAAVAPAEIAVVCAQNGVSNERIALRRFRLVYGLCVLLPAQYQTAGAVVQQSAPVPGVLDVGRYPSGADDRAVAISADLRAAGFESEVDAAVMGRKYRKLLSNLSNSLDALCGHAARTSDLAQGAEDEAAACLRAAGIDLQTERDERARRALITLRPVRGQARGGSSSWQSLARGAGSIEADWLNGEIVLLGRLHGVPTPINELLQATANLAAREGWEPGSMSLDDLRRDLS
jgi:2-dehydropantoate 2-reductase